MLPTCMVIGCVNSTHNSSIKYYRIPIHLQNICKQWYINTLREDLQPSIEHYVCVEHFDEESFYPNQQLLKDDAVPSLFEIEVFQKMIAHQEMLNMQRQNVQQQQHQQQQQQQQQQHQQPLLANLILNQQQSSASTSSVVNKCSIKSCANSLVDCTKLCDLYTLPKTSEIARKWQQACSIYDDSIKLCSLHFTQNDFNEFNYLKPDAVPTLFLLPPPSTQQNNGLKRGRSNDFDSERAPKAVKRTTTTHTGANKIQKAVKHTFNQNTIQQALNTNRNFLSAALLNNAQISTTTTTTATTTTTPTTGSTKSHKAVKHTSANNLLKDILPPPIMQSTKRAPKAVKHTGGGNFNYYNPNIQQLQLQQQQQQQQQGMMATTNGMDLLTQKLNQFVAQKNDSTLQQQPPQPHKVTYIYKRVNQPHEIELSLECEDDDDDEQVVSLQQQQQQQQKPLPPPPQRISITPTTPIYKPIASVQPLKSNAQKADNAKKLPVSPAVLSHSNKFKKEEKRHMQVLMKFYSRQESSTLKKNSKQQQPAAIKGKCSICDLVLDNNIELTSHICSHLEGVNYISPFDAVTTTCSVCDLDFSNPFDLIKHLDDEHMKKLGEYKCRICEKQHSSINELFKHLNDSHIHHEMPYRCEVCDFRTSFYADAIYHIKKEHVNSLYHFCPYCLKSLQLPYGDKVQHTIVTNFYTHLITHFNKHENNELIESKCKHCRKCILHVRYMKEHVYNDHQN